MKRPVHYFRTCTTLFLPVLFLKSAARLHFFFVKPKWLPWFTFSHKQCLPKNRKASLLSQSPLSPSRRTGTCTSSLSLVTTEIVVQRTSFCCECFWRYSAVDFLRAFKLLESVKAMMRWHLKEGRIAPQFFNDENDRWKGWDTTRWTSDSMTARKGSETAQWQQETFHLMKFQHGSLLFPVWWFVSQWTHCGDNRHRKMFWKKDSD
jgi:hypothetical protein